MRRQPVSVPHHLPGLSHLRKVRHDRVARPETPGVPHKLRTCHPDSCIAYLRCLDQFPDDAVRFAPLEVFGDGDVHAIEDGAPEVAEPDIFLHDVALVLDAQARTAGQHGRQVMVVVGVDGAAAAAVGDEGVVEQRAVAFLDRL